MISSTRDNSENDIIKFQQLNIDLNNFNNTTIKTAKIQETSTLELIKCLNIKFVDITNYNNNFEKEILPTLNND